MDLWFRFELGGVMAELGKTNEAQEGQANALYQSVATEVKHLNDGGYVVWSTHGNNTDKTIMYLSMLRSGQDVEMKNVLSDLGISDPDPETLSIDVAQVVALAHQRRQEYDQAIAAFESASRRRQSVGDEPIFTDWVEEALLELYIKQQELPRAQKFFTELITARDQWLPMNHPNRAFMRILLARVLILEKAELDRAKTLLLEARKILAKHAMAPDGPKQEIAQLLAQIDQASDSNE